MHSWPRQTNNTKAGTANRQRYYRAAVITWCPYGNAKQISMCLFFLKGNSTELAMSHFYIYSLPSSSTNQFSTKKDKRFNRC